MGLVQSASVLVSDFNFVTQIQRGLHLNCFSSVKILISQMFMKSNSNRYSPLIMLELTEIFKLDDFSCLYSFFHRSQDELEADSFEYCSIENQISDL